jgi:hypothetical protein
VQMGDISTCPKSNSVIPSSKRLPHPAAKRRHPLPQGGEGFVFASLPHPGLRQRYSGLAPHGERIFVLPSPLAGEGFCLRPLPLQEGGGASPPGEGEASHRETDLGQMLSIPVVSFQIALLQFRCLWNYF